MEERLRIVFEIKEKYSSDKERYIAKITVCLPTDEAGNLHPLLQSSEELCDEQLSMDWGREKDKFDQTFRTNTIEIAAKTLEGLREKVGEEIEEIIKMLMEIKETNIEATKDLKEYTKIYEI